MHATHGTSILCRWQEKSKVCLVERHWPFPYALASMPGRKSIRSRTRSPVAMAIGKVVRTRREEMDVSQEQFAERVSLSKNYIGNIERGEYEVAISALDRIATALKTKASEILKAAGY